MKRFVTVSRQDADFHKYLMGTFSKTEVALPIQSEDPEKKERLSPVTFEIQNKKSIEQPPFFKKWALVFRIHDLLYALLPLYLIMVKLHWDEELWDPMMALLSVTSVLLLSMGAVLLSDFFDYTQGYDRWIQGRGAVGLQKGWVTAYETRFWGVVWSTLGFGLSLPVLWVFPDLIVYVALPAALALALWLWPATGFKYQLGAEVALFFLYGPLLTLGFQSAIANSFDLECLFIGVLTGLFFVTRLHLKNFTHLMEHHRVGAPNAMSRFGFDGSQVFFRVWWLIIVALFLIYQTLFHGWEWTVIFALLSVFSGYSFLLSLRKVASPIQSVLKRFEEQATKAFALLIAAWLIQTLWYLLMTEVGIFG